MAEQDPSSSSSSSSSSDSSSQDSVQGQAQLSSSSTHSKRNSSDPAATPKPTAKRLLPGNDDRRVAPKADGPLATAGGSQRWNNSNPITTQARRDTTQNNSTVAQPILRTGSSSLQLRTSSSSVGDSNSNRSNPSKRTSITDTAKKQPISNKVPPTTRGITDAKAIPRGSTSHRGTRSSISVSNHNSNSNRSARTTGGAVAKHETSNSNRSSISTSNHKSNSNRSNRTTDGDPANNSNRSNRTSLSVSNHTRSARTTGVKKDNNSNRSARSSLSVSNHNSNRSASTTAVKKDNNSNRSARSSLSTSQHTNNSNRSSRSIGVKKDNNSNRSARSSLSTGQHTNNSNRSSRTIGTAAKKDINSSSNNNNNSNRSSRTSVTNHDFANPTMTAKQKKKNTLGDSSHKSVTGGSVKRNSIAKKNPLGDSSHKSFATRSATPKKTSSLADGRNKTKTMDMSNSNRSSVNGKRKSTVINKDMQTRKGDNIGNSSSHTTRTIRRKSTSDIPLNKSLHKSSTGNTKKGGKGVVINKDMRSKNQRSQSTRDVPSKRLGMDSSKRSVSFRRNGSTNSQTKDLRTSANSMDVSRSSHKGKHADMDDTTRSRRSMDDKSRRSSTEDMDMSKSNRARIDALRAARKSSRRNASFTTESDLTPTEQRIQVLLAKGSYHLPGNTWKQDWIQYFCNNHPLFAVCCSHRLHPISKWMRFIALLGSVMVGLVITNAVYLLLIHDDDPLGADTTPVFELSAGGFAVKNGTSWVYLEEDGEFGSLYELTAVEVSSGMVILWTAGGAIHALFDNLIWYATSCACFASLAGSGKDPGWCARCMTKYRGLCNFIVVTSVLLISAAATLAVVVRAHVEGGGEVDSAIDSLQSTAGFGSGGADVKGADSITDSSNYEFLMSYSVELFMAWFLWYPLIETVLMTGILPCVGRPKEVRREEEHELLPR